MTWDRDRSRRLLASLALAVAFVALVTWVELTGSLPGDRWVLVELYEAMGTSIDDAMVAVGEATDGLVIAAVALVVVALLAGTRRRSDALVFFVAVGVVLVANPLLKEIIGRARPDVRPSPEELSQLSLPSGHAASTAALVGALLLIVPAARWRRVTAIVGGLILVVVGFSRVAIGVHYPSDILASWLWTGSWLLFVSTMRSPDGRRTSPEDAPDRGCAST